MVAARAGAATARRRARARRMETGTGAHRSGVPSIGRLTGSARGRDDRGVELLERDREREALETAIEDSRARGVVVVVAGEPGIGKTALVSSVAAGHRVLWGACDPLITPR